MMRTAGLCGRTPKRWRTTAAPDPVATRAADLVAGTSPPPLAMWTPAVATRRPTRPAIFHRDRGRQGEFTRYTSAQCARLADRHQVLLSVCGRGQCGDNAVAESFFATIKTELLDRRTWPTRAAAGAAIFDWIEAGTTPAVGIPPSTTTVPPSTKRLPIPAGQPAR